MYVRSFRDVSLRMNVVLTSLLEIKNLTVLLILGSRPLKRFLEQLCLKEHFLKVKPQAESANGASGSGADWGMAPFGGEGVGRLRVG